MPANKEMLNKEVSTDQIQHKVKPEKITDYYSFFEKKRWSIKIKEN